jgi:hypothetical protein
MTYCVQEPSDLSSAAYPPFPALLYCFSTIDLLGSLYAGDASRSADTVNNSKKYAQHFMNYTEEQSHLMIQIFRHKLVPLAQPKFVYQDRSKSRRVTSTYLHDDREKHLRIEKLPPNSKIVVTSDWDIPIDHVFMIGILQFMNDIKNSTERPSGLPAFLGNDI